MEESLVITIRIFARGSANLCFPSEGDFIQGSVVTERSLS